MNGRQREHLHVIRLDDQISTIHVLTGGAVTPFVCEPPSLRRFERGVDLRPEWQRRVEAHGFVFTTPRIRRGRR